MLALLWLNRWIYYRLCYMYNSAVDPMSLVDLCDAKCVAEQYVY